MQRRGFSWTQRHEATWALGAILTSALMLRLYRLNAPAEDFLSWRETVTLMVARNFYRSSMNLFLPQVDWALHDTPAAINVLGGSELMVTPYLTAALYHVFGIQHWVGRIVPIIFSLLGLLVFHRLAERLYDRRIAHVGTLLLMVSPYYLYCGRTQQPESFTHAMVILTIFTFIRWVDRPSPVGFMVAAASAIAMMLGKPTMGVIAIPMAYILWRKNGFRTITAPSTWMFGVAVGIPVLAFVYWTFIAVDARTDVNLGGEGWYFAHAKWLLDPGYYFHIARSLFSWSLTPIIAIAAVVGLVSAVWQPAHRIGAAWLLGALSMFVLIPGGSETNGYYQMIVEPPACLLAGVMLVSLFRGMRMKWIAATLVPLAMLNSLYIAQHLYEPVYAAHVACGRWINANTNENVPVLNAFQSTTLLYYADRTGWNSWLKSAGPHPVFDVELVQSAENVGAGLVAIPIADYDNAFNPDFDGVRDYLYTNYLCHKGKNFTVYDLGQAANLALPPDRRIILGDSSTRKYLRGAVGPNNRPPDGPVFVPTGPGQRSGIEFESSTHPQRILLDLASAVPDHPIAIRVNGATPHQLVCDEAGVRMRFQVEPVPEPVNGNRYIVEIVTTKANAQGIGVVLFEFRAPSIR